LNVIAPLTVNKNAIATNNSTSGTFLFLDLNIFEVKKKIDTKYTVNINISNI